MGSTLPTPIIPSQHTWFMIEPPRSMPGTPSLFRDSESGAQADCYQIVLHENADYQLQLLLKHQSITTKTIVKLLDARKKIRGALNCGGKDILQIFVQKISCRFEELILSQPQILFVLREALKGFLGLYMFCGNHFKVSQNMIGLTEKGQVKVWLNDSFGCQQIEQQRLLRNEEQMIQSILLIFEKKMNLEGWYKERRFRDIMTTLQCQLRNFDETLLKKRISDKIKINELPHAVTTRNSQNSVKSSEQFKNITNLNQEIKGSNYTQINQPPVDMNKGKNYQLKQNNNVKIATKNSLIPNTKYSIAHHINQTTHKNNQNIPLVYQRPIILQSYQPQIYNANKQQPFIKTFISPPKTQIKFNISQPPSLRQVNENNICPQVITINNLIQSNKKTIIGQNIQHNKIQARYSNRSSYLRSPDHKFSKIDEQSEQSQDGMSQISELSGINNSCVRQQNVDRVKSSNQKYTSKFKEECELQLHHPSEVSLINQVL